MLYSSTFLFISNLIPEQPAKQVPSRVTVNLLTAKHRTRARNYARYLFNASLSLNLSYIFQYFFDTCWLLLQYTRHYLVSGSKDGTVRLWKWSDETEGNRKEDAGKNAAAKRKL